MNAKLLALFVIFASYGISAHADSVNRCTAADGKVSYTDTPCPVSTKKAAEVQLNTARSAAASEEPGAPADWQLKDAEFQKRRAGQQAAKQAAEQKAQQAQATQALRSATEWPDAQEKARRLQELRQAVRNDKRLGLPTPSRYYDNQSQ
ncbi:MAG: DUF4124 domain-containing protein [Collimonas sp.]|uniref:DUF4124 domain-containing protein n=1 Tax=Collimonas sp. TaxID=1963772 RepID=UPI0032653456